MPLYLYVKKEKSRLGLIVYKNRKKILKIVPLTFSIIGGFLLIASLGQIGLWQWNYSLRIDKNQILKPIPNTAIAFDNLSDNNEVSKGDSEDKSDDLSKASNWFPGAHQESNKALKAGTYTITIPKLKIKDATVVVGSDDLDRNLIHYGGTGLPGEFGTGVVFGHSVLPQFFNPTNYKTIFSTLPTLKDGDEIFVNYDGVLYKYIVIGMRVVDPSDISVLEQKYDDSYLGLVTCVPPGTYWKRLFVLTKMSQI